MLFIFEFSTNVGSTILIRLSAHVPVSASSSLVSVEKHPYSKKKPLLSKHSLFNKGPYSVSVLAILVNIYLDINRSSSYLYYLTQSIISETMVYISVSQPLGPSAWFLRTIDLVFKISRRLLSSPF